MDPIFRRIGYGFCGRVWAAPTASGDTSANKREDGGPGTSLQHDYEIHLQVLKSLPGSFPKVLVPARHEYVSGHHQNWWDRNVSKPPEGFQYDRVHNMLRSLGHSLVASRWMAKRMTANVDPLSSKTIDESSVPLWTLSLRKQLTSPPYRCGWSSAKHQRTIPRQSSWHHPLLPKEVITLYRDRRTKTKSSAALEEHLDGFVAEQEMTPPRIMQPCTRDRRVYPVGSMWRDTVRRQLQLEDLRLEFVVIRLDLTDLDGAT